MAKSPEIRRSESASKTRQTSKFSWWAIAVALVVVAGFGVYLLLSARTPSGASSTATVGGAPVLRVTPETQDLGTIDSTKGIVTISYTVENAGTGDLIIKEMETSCGCTGATLIANGQEGPRFGMRGHGSWPTGWSARLRPAETAELKVTYDPNAHGHYVGSVERLIFIYSNDPERPTVRVRFTGNQTGGEGLEQ